MLYLLQSILCNVQCAMCELLWVQSCTKVSKSVECVPCNQKIPAIGDKSGIGLSNCTEGQLAGVLSTPQLHNCTIALSTPQLHNCSKKVATKVQLPLSSTCSCCSVGEKRKRAIAKNDNITIYLDKVLLHDFRTIGTLCRWVVCSRFVLVLFFRF